MEINLWKGVCVVCVLLLNATGSVSQLAVCGQAPLNTKIVGGENAAPGFWPWQVSIQNNSEHKCGGSLINQDWVLSAAHCLQNYTAPEITIYLGMRSLDGNNPNKQQRATSNIILHHDYNNVTRDNDIALLQLSSSVMFNDYVRPVCLAASNSYFPGGTNAWVTGWGTIDSNMSLPPPKTLQEVQVPVVSNSHCVIYDIPYTNSITDNMMCAGLTTGGKDSCKGDSGGPMVVNYNGTWIQAGIVSFGSSKGCALPKIPGVYSRVSQYQDWIKRSINISQPGFVTYSTGNHGSPNLFCLYISFSIIPFLLSIF